MIMQKAKTSMAPVTVSVLLFPDFSNHCLANAVEPLRAVNNLAGKEHFSWQYLSLSGGPMQSSSGLAVQTETTLSRHSGGDFLFVMPSYRFQEHATVQCCRALRAARARFKTLVGMDSGTWLLASAGLLAGRRATIHWDEINNLAECFPDIDVVENRVVHDGDIRSCGGATTTFELVLDLIEELFGAMIRLDVAALFMHGEVDRPEKRIRPAQVPEAAVALMRRRIEQPVSIDALARQLGLSGKTLEKRCMDRFGIGPGRLYLGVRLREAKRLFEQSGMSVAEVATRCGYRDASAMTRAFRREFGVTPRDLRRSLSRQAGFSQSRQAVSSASSTDLR